MSNIRAVDLVAGDTCEWTDGRVVTLALVEGNRLVYRMPDGDLKIGDANIVARSIDAGLVKHTPAPFSAPNPAALGDLYEACRYAREWLDGEYAPETKGVAATHHNRLCALLATALAKAENKGGGA